MPLCELEVCHEQARCSVEQGKAVCACVSGFEGDGHDCQPDTDCPPRGCAPEASCVRREDVKGCKCGPGYEGDGIGPDGCPRCLPTHVLDGGRCVNERDTTCKNVSPNNAAPTLVSVTLTYTESGGWTSAPDCAWRCNLNYAEEGGECIDTKPVPCTDAAPPNATSTQAYVALTYTTAQGWSVPAACSWLCDENYTVAGSTCAPATRSTSCAGLPAQAKWNVVGQITQTWTGSAWAPSAAGAFDATPSTKACRFVCNANYTWDGVSCAADTRAKVPCTGLPARASWFSPATVNQTWTGAVWSPTTTGVPGQSSVNNACVFQCDVNTTWNSVTCAPNQRTGTCTGLERNATWNTASSITQTWSGTEWAPSLVGSYGTTASTTTCVFACKEGHKREGGNCVSNAVTCRTILDAGLSTGSGVYALDTDGPGGPDLPFSAYCDMVTEGGGWTRVAVVDATNRNHVSAVSVTPTALLTGGAGKLSDAQINRILGAGLSADFRWAIDGVAPRWWTASDTCIWDAEGKGCTSCAPVYSECSMYANGAGLGLHSQHDGKIFSYASECAAYGGIRDWQGNTCQYSMGRGGTLWAR